MTNETYSKLTTYEQQLRWALRSNFVHMTNSEFSILAAIYKEEFGEALSPGQMTCNTCRLKALQRLAQRYTDFQQKLAQEDKEERIESTNKKNAGRKKKIDID